VGVIFGLQFVHFLHFHFCIVEGGQLQYVRDIQLRLPLHCFVAPKMLGSRWCMSVENGRAVYSSVHTCIGRVRATYPGWAGCVHRRASENESADATTKNHPCGFARVKPTVSCFGSPSQSSEFTDYVDPFHNVPCGPTKPACHTKN